MFCPNCGANLPDNVQFCSNCGAQLPVQPQVGTGTEKSLDKKQIVTIVCTAVAVCVAAFLIFFFACGGCDTSSQKAIVADYVKAIAKENPTTVASLYYPAAITENGYELYELADFVTSEDTCYYYYHGDTVKSYDITVTDIKKLLKSLQSLYSAYGYDVNDMLNELYDEFEDEYDAKLSGMAIGTANVKFKDGDDVTYSLLLIKVNGKWYVAATNTGNMVDYLL